MTIEGEKLRDVRDRVAEQARGAPGVKGAEIRKEGDGRIGVTPPAWSLGQIPNG